MPFKNQFIAYSIMLFSVLFLSSCGSMRTLEREAGLRKRSISLADLGPKYLKLKNGDHDFFRKKSKRSKAPIKVRYRTFKIKKLDQFIKKSNVLYARFQYAEHSSDHFNELLNDLVDRGARHVSTKELNRAIRKRSTKDMKLRRKIDRALQSLKLTSHSLKKMLSEAQDLISMGDKVASDAVDTVKKQPTKAILAQKITLESKTTLSRLRKVVRRLPRLIKKMGKNVKVAQAASKIAKKYAKKK